MSIKTGIAWADSTASPWFGCSEVSPGCMNCYAREMTLRRKLAGWGDNAPRVKSKGFEKNVRAWNRHAWVCDSCGKFHTFRQTAINGCQSAKGHRPRIFPSLMDWLDPKASYQLRRDFLEAIWECQNLNFLLLTKRPELFMPLMWEVLNLGVPQAMHPWLLEWLDVGHPPSNVWIGVTAEDRKHADERIPELLEIPAKVRFVSVEPLLEPIHFGAVPGSLVSPIYQNRRCKVDWVIVGGESGPKRRDCGVEAICDVARQCVNAGVPVFVKQDCAAKAGQQGRIPEEIWKLKQFPNL